MHVGARNGLPLQQRLKVPIRTMQLRTYASPATANCCATCHSRAHLVCVRYLMAVVECHCIRELKVHIDTM